MRIHNRWGSPVDPVPFLVVGFTAFATCYSFGPIYLLSFDVSLGIALAASTVAFASTTTAAYHRLVWAYRPESRGEVPVAFRLRRLVLTAVAAVGLLTLLCLPLFAR